jgi:hypothetical protein
MIEFWQMMIALAVDRMITADKYNRCDNTK